MNIPPRRGGKRSLTEGKYHTFTSTRVERAMFCHNMSEKVWFSQERGKNKTILPRLRCLRTPFGAFFFYGTYSFCHETLPTSKVDNWAEPHDTRDLTTTEPQSCRRGRRRRSGTVHEELPKTLKLWKRTTSQTRQGSSLCSSPFKGREAEVRGMRPARAQFLAGRWTHRDAFKAPASERFYQMSLS